MDSVTDTSPFDPPGAPGQNGSVAPSSAGGAQPPVSNAKSPFETPEADRNRYALETRAESLNVLAYGDAVRRGETDNLRTGRVARFTDRVAGEETAELDGLLLERTGRGSRLAAKTSELTVEGRMSTSAVGWKSAPFSGEDTILLGGALTDTWTGGALIAAAMTDDLVIGVGARLSAPFDLWMNQLAGIEERPGTAASDAVMADLCGTLFEREYGAGLHDAALASFSGAVHQTQRVGFRPMMRVAVHVRNLVPGAGGAAAEPAPPAPPAAPGGAGEGALVATNLAAGAAGSVRGSDNLQDITRVAAAADEMGDAANLRHAENTAVALDELSVAARTSGGQSAGGLTATELPQAMPPPGAGSPAAVGQAALTPEDLALARMLDDYDTADALAKLEAMIDRKLELIDQVRQSQLDQLNDVVAQKLGQLDGAGVETGANPALLPAAPGKPWQDPGISTVPWRGALASDPQARQGQLAAEVDALMAIRQAMEVYEDPAAHLRDLASHANEIGGTADPRTQALIDAQRYYDDLLSAGRLEIHQGELDYYHLAKAEIAAGRDPRVAVGKALGIADPARRPYAQSVMDFLTGPVFDLRGRVPGDMDTSALTAAWQRQVNDLYGSGSRLYFGADADPQRADAMLEAAEQLQAAINELDVRRDPREALTAHAQALEAAGRTDEAAALRAAVDQYSELLEQWKAAQASRGGVRLDDVPPIPGIGDGARAWFDADLDDLPAYPGLPDEYGTEIQLAIDTPSYAALFPQNVPDELGRLLDVAPEQIADAAQNAATTGARVEADIAPPPARAWVQPQLDDGGARWPTLKDAIENVGGDSVPRGYYQTTEATPDGRLADVATVAPDTQAVVESMPVRTLPDGTQWRQTFDQLYKDYRYYRSESTWRVMAVYEDAVGVLRDDLRRAIADFGGDASRFNAEAPVPQLYDAVVELLARSTNATDTQRMQDFLEGFTAGTYDVYADLVQRGDEFESFRTGSTFPLDHHIDQDSLAEWLKSRMEDAMARGAADPTSQALRDEAAYFHQMHLAVTEGRNPLTESGDQIAYLMGKVDETEAGGELHSISKQVEHFQLHQQELIDVLSDPAFHKSAVAMGNDTYAPAHFLRPELGNPEPATMGNVQSHVFDAELQQQTLRAGPETIAGNYGANREIINGQIGEADFVDVPAQPPQGVDGVPEPPRGILRNREGASSPIDFDPGLVINSGPEGEELTDQGTLAWSRRMRAEARQIAQRTQGDIGNAMDEAVANQPGWIRRNRELGSRNPYAVVRTHAANELWDTRRPGAARAPERRGMRSWDSAALGLGSVRFGDSDVLTVAVEAEDVSVNSKQIVTRRTGSEMPWWTGSGINRAADPLNSDKAIRHVPTPRMPTDQTTRPSSWRATRQPGFGRRASAPGVFPFNAREQIVADLMQGKRLDARHIDALQTTLDDAVRTDRIRHRQWRKMTALIRDLRNGTVLGDIGPFVWALDWKTLDIMLDMLDSGAAVA